MMKCRHVLVIMIMLLVSIHCQERPNSSSAQSPAIPELELLSNNLKDNPDNADLWYIRASTFYEVGSYDAAISDLQSTVRLDSLHIDAWHLLADAYMDYYQSRLALETLEKASTLFSENISTLLKLAEFQLILKQYDDALATIDRIEPIVSNHPESLFMKGMVCKEAGDTTSAIRYFQRATAQEPQLIDAWINLGQLFSVVESGEAIRYFNAAERIEPSNVPLLHAKAVHLTRVDETQGALDTYRKLLSHDPYYADAYYNMGILYLQTDSLDQAREHFELSVKMEPGYARAYYYLGLIAELLGHVEEARSHYGQSFKLDPTQKDVEDAQKRLKDVIE